MAEGLLDKANIILTPTGYKAGTMYNVAPIEQPYEDFVFSRASVASRVNSSGLVEMVGRTLGSNLVQNGDFSEIGTDLVQNGTFNLGPELVTNGDFATDSDWSKTQSGNDTIVIENGYALFNCPDNSNIFITQSSVMTIGKTYTASFDIISIDSGGFQFGSGGGGTILGSPTANTVGTHTFTFVATTASFVIKRALGSPNLLNGKIDNVSVKEVPDWILGTGWSVQDNKAYFDNSTGTEITQSLSTTSNSYKINFDLDLQSGSCRVYFNSPGISTQITLNSSGNKTAYITTTTNHTKFTIAGTGGSEFNITNVVVQELDPNDYWNLETGWSLGDNQAIKTGSVASNFYQYSVFTTGQTYKLTFTISNSNDGRLLVYVGGNSVTEDITNTSDGTYTFYANSDNVNLVFRNVTFEGSITNVTAQEVIDTNNIPRINYDSNGENGHWLLEPTSTNEITYSEDFSQSDWIKNNTSVSANNTTSPSGIINAYKLIEDTSNSQHSIYDNVSWTSGQEYTFSAFAKKDERNILAFVFPYTAFGAWKYVSFNLENGTTITVDSGVTANIEDYGNGWYRCSATSTPNATTTADMTMKIQLIGNTQGESYLGDGTSGIYIWGAQLEALSYATSYIPTLTGSTETRATETATGAGSADLINSTEGVLYAEIAALDNDQSERQISIDDGSGNNRIILRYNSTSNNINAYLFNGSVQGGEFNHTLTDITSFIKVGFKWKANDFALWVNGVEVGSDSSGTTFSADTLNDISFDFNGLYPFYGKCKELAVFGEALSDDELEKLTSWSSFNAMATDLGYTIE